MTQDRPLLGIGLMLGFCLFAPLSDSMAKLIGSAVPLLILLWIRFALQALMLTPLVLRAPFPQLNWGLMAVRTLLHISGIGCMFLSLRYLPLADALAIAFVMPFILLLLGKYIEGEEVGMRRLLASLVGFAGTLLVIQPSFAAVGLPALLPLGVAVSFALFMMVTRRMAKLIDPVTIQCASGYIAMALLLPAALVAVLAGWIPFEPAAWPPKIWLQILALGVLGTSAHLLMTGSLRYAPSATLAPMQYLEIPIATVVGWLIFNDFPNGTALIGIAIILCAGLYIVSREHQISRRAPAP